MIMESRSVMGAEDGDLENRSASHYNEIHELDPSLPDTYCCYYEREFPMEMRLQESAKGPQDIGTLEPIRARILVKGSESDPEQICVELISDNDLFFHYNSKATAHSFDDMRDKQKLMIEFTEYLHVLVKMFNSCIKEPHSFLAIFLMTGREGEAKLNFVQNLEYRFVELLSINFRQSSHQRIRQHASQRYNLLKTQLAYTTTKLQAMQAIIRTKNPSLLLYIQKKEAQMDQRFQEAERGYERPPCDDLNKCC